MVVGTRFSSSRHFFSLVRTTLFPLLGLLVGLGAARPALADPVITAPDLVAENIQFTPTQVNLGSSFDLSVTIRNIGTAPAAAQTVQIWVSTDLVFTGSGNDVLLATRQVPALAAGASIAYDADSTATTPTRGARFTIFPHRVGPAGTDELATGNYRVAVVVDALNQVAEANESNTFFAAAVLTVGVVKPGTPAADANLGPYDGMDNVSGIRDLRWTTTTTTSRYDLYLAKLKDTTQKFVQHDIDTTGVQQVQKLRLINLESASWLAQKDIIAIADNHVNVYRNLGTLPPSFASQQLFLNDTRTTSSVRPTPLSAVIAANLDLRDPNHGETGLNDPYSGYDGDVDLVVANYGYPGPDPGVLYTSTSLSLELKGLTTEGTISWFENLGVDNNSTNSTHSYIFNQHQMEWPKYRRLMTPQNQPMFNAGRETDTLCLWGPRALVAGDLNRDGDVDVVVGADHGRDVAPNHGGQYSEVMVYLENDFCDTRPLPWVANLKPPPEPPRFYGWGVRFVYKDGAGNVTTGPYALKQEVSDVRDLALADFDKDGMLDIVFISNRDNSLGWLKNENPTDVGNKKAFAPFSLRYLRPKNTLPSPSSVYISDIDNDGDVDIIATSYLDGGQGTLIWYENIPGKTPTTVPPIPTYGEMLPTFVEHVLSTQLPEIASAIVADMDGDGLLDIVVACPLANKIMFFSNDGGHPANFTPKTVTLNADRVQSIAVGDMNFDQAPDVVAASAITDRVTNCRISWFEDQPELSDKNRVAQDLIPAHFKPQGGFDPSMVYAWQVKSKASSLVPSAGPVWTFRTQPTRVDTLLNLDPGLMETDGAIALKFDFQNKGPETLADFYTEVWITTNTMTETWSPNPNTPGNRQLKNFHFDRTLGIGSFHDEPKWDTKEMLPEHLDQGEYNIAAVLKGSAYGKTDGAFNGCLDGLPDRTMTTAFTNNSLGDDTYYAHLNIINVPDAPSLPNPLDQLRYDPVNALDAWTTLSCQGGLHTRVYDFYLAKASTINISMTTETTVGTTPQVRSVFGADMDQDGRMDVVSVSGGASGHLDWYQNNGNTPLTFNAIPILANLPNPFFVAPADINGDNRTDILVASYTDGRNTNGQIMYLKNQRATGSSLPSFKPYVVDNKVLGLNSLQGVDINGDSYQDILSASFYGGVVWYENNGAANPTFTPHVVDNKSGLASYAVAADLNGDGHQDIVAGFWNSNSIIWYENNGARQPSFTPHVLTTTAMEPRALAVADLNGDGSPDIIAASSQDNKLVWYKNNGATSPSFTPITISSTCRDIRSLVAVDFDHDSYMDLAAASHESNTITWFRNNGAATPIFTPSVIDPTAAQANSVGAADLDGDGFPELFSAATGSGRIGWYDYNFSFTFNSPFQLVQGNVHVPANQTPQTPSYLAQKFTSLPNMGFQWKVVAKNYIWTRDQKQMIYRETPGPIWTFYTGQADLVVPPDSIKLAPAAIESGATVQITFDDVNTGSSYAAVHTDEVWASPDKNFSRSDNDIFLGSVTTSATPAQLGGGTKQSMTLNVDTSKLGAKKTYMPGGTYFIAVFADTDQKVSESNEANCFLSYQALTVQPHNAAVGWKGYK